MGASLDAADRRFLALFGDALARIPPGTFPVTTVSSVRLQSRGAKEGLAGLTHWIYNDGSLHKGRQTISFYSELLDHLSDPGYLGVIVHELAHAWLNEHLAPEESPRRESEADELARTWGFEGELQALESETEPV